ncbi:NEW3 domain-containing protein [Lentzea sp.]|uniref:NEW3 domain-containing protein n=1 Tax=Lentzea sp. TaxID=56099 RepID=UPI002CF6F1F0|nr:NEW3 domain-containing protein [Lentzea sp.]HUQ54341.1 NEW3 domain-containing protein [Lentzea sp.]
MIVAEGTELFVGPRTALLQLVRVRMAVAPAGPVRAHVSGPGLRSPRHGGSLVRGPFGYEVPVDVSEHPPGAVVPAHAVVRSAAGEESCSFSLAVGSPGWTVHLVGHVAGDAPFDALRAHLDLALTDHAYRFAVTSVELLQPYWDTFPQHRSVLLRLISEGRVEVVGSESNVVGVPPVLASLPPGSALAVSSLGEAKRSVYSSFLELRSSASAPHVMLPVGSSRSAPNPWVTAVHHDWSARYTWPRVICSLPRDYYVRGSVPVPAAPPDDSPAAVMASHAARLTGSSFPSAALSRAARAHPREAFDLRSDVIARSAAALTSTVDSSVVVWNPLPSPCTDIVSVDLPVARRVQVSFEGSVLPTLVDGATVTFLARDVPACGWRTYELAEGGDGSEVERTGPSPLVGVLGSRSPSSGTLSTVVEGSPAGVSLGPVTPAVTPVFARYWLHEPAPLGGLPVNVHFEVLSPTCVRVVVVSNGADFSGVVRLSLPDGWSASWTEWPVTLPAGGHVSADVRLAPPRTPGCYPLRATVEGAAFDVYDVVLLTVPEWDSEDPVEVLWVASSPSTVSVRPGTSAVLRVVMASGARGDLPLQARVLSPRSSWDLVGPFCVGGLLPAQGRTSLDFTVSAPAWARPGSWPAVVSIAAGDLVRTTPPITLLVTMPPRD